MAFSLHVTGLIMPHNAEASIISVYSEQDETSPKIAQLRLNSNEQKMEEIKNSNESCKGQNQISVSENSSANSISLINK